MGRLADTYEINKIDKNYKILAKLVLDGQDYYAAVCLINGIEFMIRGLTHIININTWSATRTDTNHLSNCMIRGMTESLVSLIIIKGQNLCLLNGINDQAENYLLDSNYHDGCYQLIDYSAIQRKPLVIAENLELINKKLVLDRNILVTNNLQRIRDELAHTDKEFTISLNNCKSIHKFMQQKFKTLDQKTAINRQTQEYLALAENLDKIASQLVDINTELANFNNTTCIIFR